MKPFLFLSILLISTAISCQTNQDRLPQMTEYIGKAQTSKQGAGLVVKNGTIYFLKGKSEWEGMYEGKLVLVKGILTAQESSTPLKNEKGEYSTGVEGTQFFLENYQLPKVRESSSFVVVFKKNIPDQTSEQILDKYNYPHWEGMDSSKGKKYFYSTGKKYFMIFPTEKEKLETMQMLNKIQELHEIYTPDWQIQKD